MSTEKVQVEDVLQSLTDWQEAKKELLTCYANADTSPGYFCYSLAEEEKQAREKFGKVFELFIDDRIEAATGARP